MRAIKVTAANEATLVNLPDEETWRHISKEIGPQCELFEIVRVRGLPRNLVMVVDESGLYHSLRDNKFGGSLYRGAIAGDLLLMAEGMTDDGPDFVDMTDEQITEVKQMLLGYLYITDKIEEVAK